jgi:hypothetical protein
VFIAAEQGRPMTSELVGEGRVSVVTLTELRVGVLRAPGTTTRALRERTLSRAESFVPLAYDEAVSRHLAALIAAARTAGRRAGAMDAIIAATALSHDLLLLTRDDDFDVLAALEPALRVVRV